MGVTSVYADSAVVARLERAKRRISWVRVNRLTNVLVACGYTPEDAREAVVYVLAADRVARDEEEN